MKFESGEKKENVIDDKDPRGLKGAYEADRGIETNNNGETNSAENSEGSAEKLSYEEVGKQKCEKAFLGISEFIGNLTAKGKEAIYKTIGFAYDAPDLAHKAGQAAAMTGEKAYASAEKLFTEAVKSAKEKAGEIKNNLVEGVKEAKRSFFERITNTKDKYVNKANELKNRGVKWGIDKSAQVKNKVTETYNKVDKFVTESKIRGAEAGINRRQDNIDEENKRHQELIDEENKRHQEQIDKENTRMESEKAKLAELMAKLNEERFKAESDRDEMGSAEQKVSELTA